MLYFIKKHCIFRQNEAIVFDSKKFVIHKLNANGVKIIRILEENPVNFHTLSELCHFIKKPDLEEFIEKSIQSVFVDSSKGPLSSD